MAFHSVMGSAFSKSGVGDEKNRFCVTRYASATVVRQNRYERSGQNDIYKSDTCQLYILVRGENSSGTHDVGEGGGYHLCPKVLDCKRVNLITYLFEGVKSEDNFKYT